MARVTTPPRASIATDTVGAAAPARAWAGAAVAVAVCGWGLAPVATRFAVATVSPATLLTLRFTIAAAVLAPVAARARWWRGRGELRLILAPALLGVAGYNGAVTFGVQSVSASSAGMLLATEPLLMLAFSFALAREPLARSTVAGFAVSLAGVLALSAGAGGVPGSTHDSALGLGLVLLAAACFAAYAVTLRPLAVRHGAVSATAVTTVLGVLPLVVLLPLVKPEQVTGIGAGPAAAIAGLALGSSVAAMMLWNHGVAVLGGVSAGPGLFTIPLVTFAGGTLLLGEHPGALSIGGGVLILLGVGLTLRGRRSAG